MRLTKVLGTLTAAALVAFTVACEDAPTTPEMDVAADFGVGNNLPPGKSYILNIHGVDSGVGFTIPKDGNNGHNIFVPLKGKCDIGLQEGDYHVGDNSCLDGDRAEFYLPDPADSDSNGKLEYSVYAKALTPNGSATIQTCYQDGSGTWCNVGDLIVNLSKNNDQFKNVTKELLQVCVDTDPTATVDLNLVPLFSAGLLDQWWHYDNNGLRLAQLRFHPLETTDQGGDCTGQRGPHPAH